MCIPENIHTPHRGNENSERCGGEGGARKVISEGVGGGLLIMEIPGSGGADMTALLRLVGDLKQKCPWVWIVFGTTQK